MNADAVLSYEDEEEVDTEEEFVCERYDGPTMPIQGTNKLTAFILIHVPIDIPAFALSAHAEPDMHAE